jgi:spore germination protein YaaH
MPKLRRRLAVASALISAALALSACTTSPTTPFQITGYAEEGATSNAQLSASASDISQVGVDGVSLTPDASGVTEPDAAATALLAKTHALHLTASLLVSNWSNAINDFSDPLVEKMFDSPAKIRSVVSALAREVKSGGWDGVTIDLESLNQWGAAGHTRDDNAGLLRFVKALRSALGSRPISICLTATTGSYADLGYDTSAIAPHVDDVVLMAYDQHGPTWSAAGPVGGYPWVDASVHQLMKSVPAAKIQLGVGEYGYTWPKHGTGTTYSVRSARALVKRQSTRPTWSTRQLEWHATFANGETIWWSDGRSYRARLALARKLHLGGVAVWSLGEGDAL